MTVKTLKKTYAIKSDLKKVQPLVKEILLLLKRAGIEAGILDDIKLVMDEAIINAVKHGNKSDPDLSVNVRLEADANKIKISVQDEGEGYGYDKLSDPTLDENIEKGHGRGVFLIKRLVDEVRFNKAGNKVEIIKRI